MAAQAGWEPERQSARRAVRCRAPRGPRVAGERGSGTACGPPSGRRLGTSRIEFPPLPSICSSCYPLSPLELPQAPVRIRARSRVSLPHPLGSRPLIAGRSDRVAIGASASRPPGVWGPAKVPTKAGPEGANPHGLNPAHSAPACSVSHICTRLVFPAFLSGSQGRFRDTRKAMQPPGIRGLQSVTTRQSQGQCRGRHLHRSGHAGGSGKRPKPREA